MNTQIPVMGGVLTITLLWSPAVSFIFGFQATGQAEHQETYGGCDQKGSQELARALSAGRDAFVYDAGSGPMHAHLIWDQAACLLTLRAAGESTDIHLGDAAQHRVRSFLQNALEQVA